MPTLNIGGRRVKVDDSFLSMSPDQQNAAVEEIAKSLPQGDAQAHSSSPAAPVDMASVYADEMLFGLPGKAAAGVGALIRAPFTDKSIGEEYSGLRDAYQNAREDYAEEHPARNVTASLAGGILGAGKFLKGGKLAADAVAPAVVKKLEKNIVGRAAGEAAGGAAIGGLSGYGHDQSVAEGALIGGALGGAARPVVEGATGAANAIGGMLGVGNQGRAQRAIYEALTRSGKTADDVTGDLATAAREGQPEYMLADALGNSGQRMLAGVARTPGDMRQTIADTLMQRQAGQGERLVNALAEGFNAPKTAAQTETALTAARRTAADANYGAARESAEVVDPTNAIKLANDFLRPGAMKVMRNSTNIADDSVEGAVKRARSYLTDGKSVLTDFDAAFRAKIELDNMIDGAKPAVQRQLVPIRNALDDALSDASDKYAAARNTFRKQSKAIEAVDTGRSAASSRTRAADNVQQFSGLSPEEQASFRVGYADPLIARVESASMSPTTNKARTLITEKTGQEFPAFAAPGKGEQLGSRIARENRMFQTANAALGGSKTADNLADIGEMAAFDPSIIGSLATGNIKGAIVQGLTKGAQALNGRNNQTRDMIAKMLLQGSPTKVKADLASAIESGEKLTEKQAAIVRLLIGATAPRLAAN